MSSPQVVAATVAAVKGVADINQSQKEKGQKREANEDQRLMEQDASNRREATYRTERQKLNGAIDQFYNKIGVEPPKGPEMEGAYTTTPMDENDTLSRYNTKEDVYSVIPEDDGGSLDTHNSAKRNVDAAVAQDSEAGLTKMPDSKKLELIKKLTQEMQRNGSKR